MYKLSKENIFFWLRKIGEQFQASFLILDSDNQQILFANDQFSRITGYIVDEVINQSFHSLFYIEPFHINGRKKEIFRTKDGSHIWIELMRQPFFDDEGNHVYNVIIFFELEKKKIPSEEKGEWQKFLDPISGLTNYNYFVHVLGDRIEKHTTGFVLLIQPSNYIQVVDRFGKHQLSLLQKEIEQRVRHELCEIEAVISRATEASLIVLGICREDQIEYYTKKLLRISDCPFQIEQIDLYLSFSIGVVPLSYYAGNVDELVRFADIALSVAKKRPGNSMVLYKEEYGIEVEKEMELQNELIRAIQQKEIDVHLQPKVKIDTGEVEGFEALARWFSNSLGQVSPAVFIEAAESLGKIKELEYIVIERVLKWLKSRKERNMKLYQVAVNISPSHFYAPTFVEDLITMTKKYGIEPKYIKLEITENIGLVDLERAKTILQQLQQYGFENSVDDFGCGFSSLSYLNQLPISEIKIARSFVNKVVDRKGRIIVQSIIQLANSMGLHTVAEGIETEEQLEAIHQMACPTAQGFYFYKPMPIERVDELIK